MNEQEAYKQGVSDRLNGNREFDDPPKDVIDEGQLVFWENGWIHGDDDDYDKT